MTRAATVRDTAPLFLVNPAAGRVARAGSLLERAGHAPQTVAMDALETQLAGPSGRLVVVEGGDGTLRAVIEALIRTRRDRPLPPVLALPGGTTNLIAGVLGAPKDQAALSRVLGGAGATRALPTLRVAQDGRADRHGFLLGTGTVARAVRLAKARVPARGLGGALGVLGTLTALALGRGRLRRDLLRPTPIRLQAEGITLSDHRLALATTLPRLVGGLDPFWAEGEDALRVTAARADSRRLALGLLRLRLGRTGALDGDGYVSIRTDTLRLAPGEPFVLDGEPEPGGPITVTPGPLVPFWCPH